MESALGYSIDEPDEAIGRPVECKGVRGGLRASNIVGYHTVVRRRVAFTEVVGLDVGRGRAEEFPIDFIQVVRFEDNRANNALSRGRLHLDFNVAEEEIAVGLDCWSITALVDCKLSTVGIIGEGACSNGPSRESCSALREIGGEGSADSLVCWAGFLCGIT